MAMVPTMGHLGEANMFVEITDIHRSVAQDAADRASETIDRYGLCDSAGYRRPDRLPSWDGHYLGALAEIIVSDVTGLPWGQYDYGRVDVGDDIEVRRVQRPDTGRSSDPRTTPTTGSDTTSPSTYPPTPDTHSSWDGATPPKDGNTATNAPTTAPADVATGSPTPTPSASTHATSGTSQP